MKDRILDVAAGLIISYGLRKFTIDEIASELKISKKTIYRYFASKDEIIREYFAAIVVSDRKGVEEEFVHEGDFQSKLHAIVHANHRYRLPVSVVNEAERYFPEEYAKLEELRRFKLEAAEKLLADAMRSGLVRGDLNLALMSRLLERIGELAFDTDFLIENKLKGTEAVDLLTEILCHGILVTEPSAKTLG